MSSQSPAFQRIHVICHLNYQPFVCKVSEVVGGRKVVCNEAFIQQNFLKTHLKSEHKLTTIEKEISKHYELHSIPKVQHLIDSTLKKLTQSTNNQSVDPIPGQSSSTHKRSVEVGDNSAPNKRLRTEPDLQTVNRGSGSQSIRLSINNENSNDQFGPPSLEPVSANHRNFTMSGPPQLAPANSISPPLLVNQMTYNPTNIPNTSQMQSKRGRGRPKGSKTKTNNRSNNKNGQSSGTNGKQVIPPNCYVADGNPQLKSRLSKESRLSRPNISLSREQERALQSKRFKTNGNNSMANTNINGDESSDWDSETETYGTNLRSDEHRVIEPTVSYNPLNERLSTDSPPPSDENRVERVIPQQISRAPPSSSRSLVELPSPPRQNKINIEMPPSMTFHNILPTPSTSTSEPTQPIEKSREINRKTITTQTEENKKVNTLIKGLTDGNNERMNGSPTLVTQITRVEESESMDSQTDIYMNSSPDTNLQNEEPAITQNNSLSGIGYYLNY